MATRTPWTRDRVKRYLVQRFYTRFHMSLILSSSGLAAMLASAVLLALGVTAMLVRYPVAIAVAYLTFLAGVWLWLRYVGLAQAQSAGRSVIENADIPDMSIGSGSGGSGTGSVGSVGKGGGTFDGGGASGSWAQARAPGIPANLQTQALAGASQPDGAVESPWPAPGGGTGRGSSGFSLGDFGDLDGESVVLLILALAVVAAIFVASGYLVWFAPDILAEAAFGALLAGGLTRRAKREDAQGWVAGVIRKTWLPFAMVLVVAIAFAWYAAAHFPAARTFKEAVAMALSA